MSSFRMKQNEKKDSVVPSDRNRDHTTCTQVKSCGFLKGIFHFAIADQLQCTFIFIFLFHCRIVTNNCVKQCAVLMLRQWAKCKFPLWNWQTKENQFDRKKCHQMLVIVWLHCEHTQSFGNVRWIYTIERGEYQPLCTFPIHTEFLAN